MKVEICVLQLGVLMRSVHEAILLVGYILRNFWFETSQSATLNMQWSDYAQKEVFHERLFLKTWVLNMLVIPTSLIIKRSHEYTLSLRKCLHINLKLQFLNKVTYLLLIILMEPLKPWKGFSATHGLNFFTTPQAVVRVKNRG